MEESRCFICGTNTILYLKNLDKIKSKHSKSSVAALLKLICAENEVAIIWWEEANRREQHTVCMQCMGKINEYDEACVIKERIEREFQLTLQRQGNRVEVKIENVDDIAELPLRCEFTTDSDDSDDVDPKEESWQNAEMAMRDEHDESYSSGDETFHLGAATAEVCSPKRTFRSKNGRQNRARKDLKIRDTQSSESTQSHKKAKPPKCSLCGIVADDEISLEKHKTLHEGKPALQCIICGLFLINKASMVRHTRIHTGSRTLQCERCGKSFMHYSSLQMHIKAHENIREKQCPHCPLQFRSTSHLNRHLRIHTGDKPFSCPKCQQRFAQRYNMTVHLRLHDSSGKSKALPKHVCTICETAFPRPSKLAEHYCRAHETMVPHANGNEVDILRENPVD